MEKLFHTVKCFSSYIFLFFFCSYFYQDQIASLQRKLFIRSRLKRVDNTSDEWQTDAIVRHGLVRPIIHQSALASFLK